MPSQPNQDHSRDLSGWRHRAPQIRRIVGHGPVPAIRGLLEKWVRYHFSSTFSATIR